VGRGRVARRSPDATHDPGVFTLVEPYDDRGRPGRHRTSRI